MDELEAIRKKRLEQLKEQQQKKHEEQAQFNQQVNQLEGLVKQYMTKDALSRYGNLKTAHQEKAVQLLSALGQLIQNNKITKINDYQLKEILKRISPKKRDTKITRK